MKHFLFALLFTVMAVFVHGQERHVGIKAIGSRNILTEDLANEPLYTLSGGLTYEALWEDRYSVEVDLLYLRRGAKDRSHQLSNINKGRFTQQEQEFVYYYRYLGLPIKGGFHFGDRFYFAPHLGIMPAYLVEAGHIARENGISKNSDHTSEVNRFDLAGLLELTAGYKINEKIRILTSIDAQQSFTSLSTQDYFSSWDLKHGALNLSVGLKYQLPE